RRRRSDSVLCHRGSTTPCKCTTNILQAFRLSRRTQECQPQQSPPPRCPVLKKCCSSPNAPKRRERRAFQSTPLSRQSCAASPSPVRLPTVLRCRVSCATT